MQRFDLQVDGERSVSALRSVPNSPPHTLFIYAPGAGSGLNDPFGAYCADRLSSEGIECWRFQFPYMEANRRAPDRTPVLEATWRSAIEKGRETGSTVVVGGRSMGGRMASRVVAQGTEVAALALFAYPLHPPGRPDQRRDEHLGSITVPTLFCSGDRDAFASPEELDKAASLVPDSSVHLLQGADHGFATLKSGGRGRADVWAEAIDALDDFLKVHLAVL